MKVIYLLIGMVSCLHLYVDVNTPKCFLEDLPSGTILVVSYKAELYDPSSGNYIARPETQVRAIVTHTASKHSNIDQKGHDAGKFRLVAAESGDHTVCFTISPTIQTPRAKLYLDVQFDKEDASDEQKKSAYSKVFVKANQLRHRVGTLRSEMRQQRYREEDFRDASETVNASSVRWTLFQMVLIGVTAAWQLSALKTFFIKAKVI